SNAGAARPSTSRSPTSRASRYGSDDRGAVAAVRGRAVTVDRRDPEHRRVAHRRRREVAQRVVVRALALHAAEAEALGGEAARESVALPRPRAAQRPVLVRVEPG